MGPFAKLVKPIDDGVERLEEELGSRVQNA